jgi:hypothetical protein
MGIEMLKVGTRVETKGLPAFAGFPGVAPEQMVIVKPRKVSLPLPGPDWYIVKFIRDGGLMCMHKDGFRVISNH